MPIGQPGTGNVGEGHITILPINYQSITSGTWTQVVRANDPMNCYFRNTPANTDDIKYKIYLDAGTYTLRIVGVQANNYGILTVKLDTTPIATFDWYAAGTAYNHAQTQTAITVAIAGLKDLELSTPTKHASSSGYLININQIGLWRTA